jgi:hypothetical protein
MKNFIAGLTEERAKEILLAIIEELDGLDQDDMFGTEGWRESFGIKLPRA